MSESEDTIKKVEGPRGKVMGILAIVVGGIAVVIPVVGVYLTAVSGILAALSYGKSALLGYIAVGINIISLAFLSPLLWVAASADNSGGSIAGLVWILLGIQAAAVVFVIWKTKRANK